MNEEREPPSQQTFSPSLSLALSLSLSLFFFFSSVSLTLPSCLCKAVRECECVCVYLQHALAVIHPPLPSSLLASLQPPQYSLLSRDIRVSQSLKVVSVSLKTEDNFVNPLTGHLCSHKSHCNRYYWL